MSAGPAYWRPASVSEAVDALSSSDRAAAIAGGTDLMNDLRLGLAQPDLVVDTADLADLVVLRPGDGVMGAATTMRTIIDRQGIGESYPALRDAALLLGGRQMQAVATVGGNICHASPAAETATPLLVYDAVAILAGPAGPREIAMTQFWEGARRSCLRPGELLVELRLNPPDGGAFSAYRRLELRRSVDIAVVSCAVSLNIDGGMITGARVAVGAVAPTPRRVPEAEEVLRGVDTTDDRALASAVSAAGAECGRAAVPIDDTRASGRYRTAMIPVIASRCVEAALARAEPG